MLKKIGVGICLVLFTIVVLFFVRQALCRAAVRRFLNAVPQLTCRTVSYDIRGTIRLTNVAVTLPDAWIILPSASVSFGLPYITGKNGKRIRFATAAGMFVVDRDGRKNTSYQVEPVQATIIHTGKGKPFTVEPFQLTVRDVGVVTIAATYAAGNFDGTVTGEFFSAFIENSSYAAWLGKIVQPHEGYNTFSIIAQGVLPVLTFKMKTALCEFMFTHDFGKGPHTESAKPEV